MTTEQFLEAVVQEADRAVKKHGEFHSLHEAWAVLYEEVDELWEEVRKKRSKRVKEEIEAELIQIAGACLKTIHMLESNG